MLNAVANQHDQSFRQRLLTPVEVAALVQVSSAVIGRAIKRGDLVARRLGNEYRIALPDLARFLTCHTTLHRVDAGASETELLGWLERAVERLRPRYSPPEMERGRSGGERFERDA
jgi:excisionase family DNA binding protein